MFYNFYLKVLFKLSLYWMKFLKDFELFNLHCSLEYKMILFQFPQWQIALFIRKNMIRIYKKDNNIIIIHQILIFLHERRELTEFLWLSYLFHLIRIPFRSYQECVLFPYQTRYFRRKHNYNKSYKYGLLVKIFLL